MTCVYNEINFQLPNGNPIPKPGWLDDFIKWYLAQFPKNQPNDATPGSLAGPGNTVTHPISS